MQGHSPRQREILQLMGVDIWRLREMDAAAMAPVDAEPDGREAGVESRREEGADWLFSLTSAMNPGGIFLVRERQRGDTGNDATADRLVASIALALTSGSGAPGLVEASPAGGQSPDSGESNERADWVPIADRFAPRLTVVLGEACGRWLSAAGRGAGKVVVAENPDNLLARPDRKAALWRAIVGSGALHD